MEKKQQNEDGKKMKKLEKRIRVLPAQYTIQDWIFLHFQGTLTTNFL